MASLLPKVVRGALCRGIASTPVPCSRILPPRTFGIAMQQRCFSAATQRRARRYTETHEWIDVGADGKTCTIGISTYAAGALGDVVYVELPGVGDEATEGEPFGTVESVKSASDVNSPVSGTVIEINEGLDSTPADLGKDPEGDAWLVKIEASDVSAVEGLMDEGAYAEHTKDK